MRQLVLLLILANVCVYFWANYVDVPEAALTAEAPIAPQKTPTLRLARERDSNVVASIASELSCISVGPLTDDAQSRQLAQRLQAAGFSSVARVETGEVFAGYWVTLQGFNQPSEAEVVLKKLESAGVSDAFVLAEEQPPVLSLGLFSEQERADKRSAEIAALGYKPVIQNRMRSGQTQWLDISLQEPGQQLDPALLQSGSAGIVRLETKSCPVSSASSSASLGTSSEASSAP